MNFNVYLDDATVDRLNSLARKRGTTRNALIREAVAHLLESRSAAAWPALVREFEGESGVAPFEASRSGMRPPKKDPFR